MNVNMDSKISNIEGGPGWAVGGGSGWGKDGFLGIIKQLSGFGFVRYHSYCAW